MTSIPRSVIKEKCHYPFYAVARGILPDVYLTWQECFYNTHGVSRNLYKGFHSFAKARDFVDTYRQVLTRRRKMSSRGASHNPTPTSHNPTHGRNAYFLANNIVYLIFEAKFLASSVYLVIRRSRLLTRGDASLIIHAIGDGLEYGDWDVLKKVCKQLDPPVVADILRRLHALSKTEDPTHRQKTYRVPTRQDSSEAVFVANIDDSTYVCRGAGKQSGASGSGVGQG